MLNKLKGYLNKYRVAYKKERYLELLKEFEHPHVGIEHIPKMLACFWSQLDVNTLSGILPAEWMYIQLNLRHNNIAELIYSVQDYTNAIAQDDYTTIENASKEKFIQIRRVDLDTYLVNLEGESLRPLPTIKSLKDNLMRHGEIIETIQSTAYARLLHRFYQDILTLTTVLVENIKA